MYEEYIKIVTMYLFTYSGYLPSDEHALVRLRSLIPALNPHESVLTAHFK